MSINADTLLYRLHLKAQVARWRLVAVLAVAAAILVYLETTGSHSPIEGDFIARLTIEGVVMDDQKLYDLITDVEENTRAKAVVVWLDTPGGSAVAGEEVYFKLRQLSKKKPVVAVIRSVAASAGYMIALGADHVIAREGSITGSIGVLIETVEVTELTEKLGIKPVVIKTSPLKAAPNPLEKVTPEAEQVVRTVINDFYERFVDIVTERRKLPREHVVSLADGRIYSGKRAMKYKLIDGLGGEKEALLWLQKHKDVSKNLEIKDISIKEPMGVFDGLAESASKIFFKSSSLRLDGIAAVWHPELH
ncbi:MAG: signal peptide peptidase SppA [Alphaproteobacteria bacterium]